MSSSYRSNRLGLSHWDPYAVRTGSCLELYYCNMVEWFWWDSSLILTTFPSVLWHCWFGHLACKNRPWNDLLCVEWDVKPYTLTHLEHHLLHQSWCETWSTEKKTLIITKYVHNVWFWRKHKHAGMLAIGQLYHQSATAPSCTTHAIDAAWAHRCHELWSRTHVAKWQTKWHNSVLEVVHRSSAMASHARWACALYAEK